MVKVGDNVRLTTYPKSPVMVVTKHDPELFPMQPRERYAVCSWYSQTAGEVRSAQFPIQLLTKVELDA